MIGDLMRALNPFQGPFYREALEMSRVAREMYCLMGGRHAHPSTLYPGGVGTVADLQLLTGIPRAADEVYRFHQTRGSVP